MVATAVERSWCLVIPHRPHGSGLARRRLAAAMSELVPADLLADVITVLAELVGNAVRHARGLDGDVVRVAWSLRVEPQGQVINVRVTDGGGPGVPHVRPHSVDAPDGRGIAIVAALSTAWGVVRDGAGQCVWAELRAAAP